MPNSDAQGQSAPKSVSRPGPRIEAWSVQNSFQTFRRIRQQVFRPGPRVGAWSAHYNKQIKNPTRAAFGSWWHSSSRANIKCSAAKKKIQKTFAKKTNKQKTAEAKANASRRCLWLVEFELGAAIITFCSACGGRFTGQGGIGPCPPDGILDSTALPNPLLFGIWYTTCI